MISIYDMDTTAYLKKLKEACLKITPRRKAVIELFLKENRYLGPYEVRLALKERSIKLGFPSVYRILEELKEAGVLVKIEHKSRQLYYSLCRKPHLDHHHFICRKCNKVEEVEFCNFHEISRFIQSKLHGRVEKHALQIEGLCSGCK